MTDSLTEWIDGTKSGLRSGASAIRGGLKYAKSKPKKRKRKRQMGLIADADKLRSGKGRLLNFEKRAGRSSVLSRAMELGKRGGHKSRHK